MIRTFSVKDIPPELRKEGAAKVKMSIRQLLSNPFLSEGQVKYLSEKMEEIARWENGELPVQPPLPEVPSE